MNTDTPLAHGPAHALTEHLEAVADLAARRAPPGAQPWARLAGLWHDLGKFRPGFQRYIRQDENAHIEGRGVAQRDKSHSAAGALHALQSMANRFGPPGRAAGWLLAHLIAAHHAGLYDAAALKDRLLEGGSGGPDSGREYREALAGCTAHAPGLLEVPEALDARTLFTGIPGLREAEPLAQALWLRMLFSALVDADFLDTEAYLDRGRAERRAGFPPLAEQVRASGRGAIGAQEFQPPSARPARPETGPGTGLGPTCGGLGCLDLATVPSRCADLPGP